MESGTFVLLYSISILSFFGEAFAQRSCFPGTFCRIDANCTGINVESSCVTQCPTYDDHMQQGNHLTGKCERIPIGTDHWMDSTFYELFILSNQPVNTRILTISFISSEQFQTNNYTLQDLVEDITFTLIVSTSYFYFSSMLNEQHSFENYYDFYIPDTIESVELAIAEPVPLGDYNMTVVVTNDGNELERREILVHVIDISDLPYIDKGVLPSATNGVLSVKIGSPVYIIKGFNITIVCDVTSKKPPVTIRWFHNENQYEGNVSAITVTDVKHGDVFICRADNSVGFDIQKTEINFANEIFCI